MMNSGCAAALATDLNPGSCCSGSIPLTFALACLYSHLTLEEAITAMTLNGAAALGYATGRKYRSRQTGRFCPAGHRYPGCTRLLYRHELRATHHQRRTYSILKYSSN